MAVFDRAPGVSPAPAALVFISVQMARTRNSEQKSSMVRSDASMAALRRRSAASLMTSKKPPDGPGPPGMKRPAASRSMLVTDSAAPVFHVKKMGRTSFFSNHGPMTLIRLREASSLLSPPWA